MRMIKLIISVLVALSIVSAAYADQFHPASEISPGQFRSGGNYIIPTSLGINSTPSQLLEVKGIGRIQLTDPGNPNKWIAFRNQAAGLDLSYQGAPLWLSAYDNQNIILNPGSGNVGIGTTSPGEKLTVAGNIDMSGTNGRRIYMGGVAGGNFGIAYNSIYPNYGIFYLEGSPDRVVLSPDGGGATGSNFVVLGNGNVGIGTTSPGAKLDVNGTLKVNSNSESQFITGDSYIFLQPVANDRGRIGFYDTSSGWLDLILQESGGNVGIGTTNPQTALHILRNAGTLNLEGADHTYIQWYPDGFAAGRKAWTGFGSATDDNFYITNQINGAHIILLPTNGNVGIGTTPSTNLDVNGNVRIRGLVNCNTIDTDASGNFICGTDETGAGYWTLSGSNLYPNNLGWNVGIGTNSPSDKLHVNGRIITGVGGTTQGVLSILPSDGGSYFHIYNAGGVPTTTLRIGRDNWPSPTDLVAITNSGNVGIGTISPTYKLDVNGTARIGPLTSGLNGLILESSSGNAPFLTWYNGASRMSQRYDGSYWYLGTGDASGFNSLVTVSTGGNLNVAGSANAQQLCIAGNCQSSWPSGIGGSGSDNYIPRWNGATALENSVIYQTDGGNVGIGTTPGEKLDVQGNLRTSGLIYSTYDGYDQTYLRSWGLSGAGAIFIEPAAGNNLYLTDSWSKTGILDFQFGKYTFQGGNVGIGTDPGTNKLKVDGNTEITGNLSVSGKITTGSGTAMSCKTYYYYELRAFDDWDLWYDIDISQCYLHNGCFFRLSNSITGYNPSYTWKDCNRVQGSLGVGWGYPSGGVGNDFIYAEGTRNDGAHQNYEALNGPAAGSDVAISSTYGDYCMLYNSRTNVKQMRLRFQGPFWNSAFGECVLTICPYDPW